MEEINQLKAKRTQVRRHITKCTKELETLLAEKDKEVEEITVSYDKAKDKADRLFSLDKDIEQMLFSNKAVEEDDLNAEFDSVENYRETWCGVKSKYDQLLKSLQNEVSSAGENVNFSAVGLPIKKCFQLPKLELIQFDGNVKNWIGFWGQFKKVHNDADIDPADKFQYLVQSMKPGSSARELVESFPPSGENYTKAIDQLKARFARDEFLIEVYVRELLNLVLQQATNKSNAKSMTLCKLYDSLETQLRALETLGVTSDKYAAMLYPLVESSLPEETLKVWERCRVNSKSVDQATNVEKSSNYLQELLNFLKLEVESEERLALAKLSFTQGRDESKPKYDRSKHQSFMQSSKNRESNTPSTAATLLETKTQKDGIGLGNLNCLFCKKTGHCLHDCFGFQKMSLDDKTSFVTKNGVCFSCLKRGHVTKQCKKFVSCAFCQKKHYAVLCKDLDELKKSKTYEVSYSESKLSTGKNDQKSEVLAAHGSETLLQTLMVQVHDNKGKSYLARALLDTGSQRSYVKRDCVKKLGLHEMGKEEINHSLFGGVNVRSSHKTYLITLKNVNNEFKYTIPVHDQDVICNYVPRLNDITCLSVLKEKNISLTDFGEQVPDVKILLGSDVLGDLFTGKLEKLDNGLTAMETHLGWTLMGKVYDHTAKCNSLVSLFCQGKVEISDLWNLESIGIKDPTEMKSRSHMEAEAVKHFSKSVKINEENRYEVELPWIEGHPKLLNNREVAVKRLFSTTRKLQSLNKFDEYNKVFDEWLEDGIIEAVPETLGRPNTDDHYLPHHAVIKEGSSTTKIRPVFDASAKDKRGNSLNSCLEKGPNLIEMIPSLVLKFRSQEIGVVGDIKKAFLQISLCSKDRDYLKFLWWSDYNSRKIITYRHCRVVFGVSSSPFLLSATINHHLGNSNQEFKEIAETLKHSFYVDNCITSVSSVDNLKRFIQNSSDLMKKGQFELREWASSHGSEDEELKGILSTNGVISVLGMLWNTADDELYCDINSITVPLGKLTKRNLLSVTQRLFDVVGFTSPVSLIPKLLLQEVWLKKLTWDDDLPTEISEKFFKWIENIHWLDLCRIPRRMSFLESDTYESSIHVFCDGSKLAYAACLFIRTENENEVNVQLLCAKSRIAPTKPITIPRLELLAALIGARLYSQVKEIVKHNRAYFWTDSTTALTWINMKEDWSTFVGNRCKEICQITNKGDWHYVPGPMNPADLPSRGCGAKNLYESKWWQGPSWLKEKEETWPRKQLEVDEEALIEKKKTVVSAVAADNNSQDFTNSLLYFSKYSKLLRMMAWVLRFINNTSPKGKSINGLLTIDELNEAERKIVQQIQTESFKDKASLKNLLVFSDEKGILRVKTKLTLTDDHEGFKYPIILPSNHPIVHRLITEHHIKNLHAGTETVLTIMRETFWIIRGRKTVRSVLSKCIKCKRFKVQAGQSPPAPLPLERITCSKAFETTGIDAAGPLYLKNGNKSWIILFTCAVYRAVHLELVESLSSEAFIAALRRFIARRGRISTIFTDNGTNFIGTNNQLKQINWKEISEKFEINRIEWKFNPPSSPWWGGFWERLVRVIKELLRRNLGLSSLTYEELLTVLCECEATINARPLTYLSDSFETLQPLTPSMFLQPILNVAVEDLNKIDSNCLNKRVRYLLNVREGIKRRFQKEYLSLLVHRLRRKSPNQSAIQVGDVVLIGDDNVKRVKWPLAIVTKLFSGKDGASRVALLKTATGELKRPIQRLFSLEISAEDIDILNTKRAENLKKVEPNLKKRIDVQERDYKPDVTQEPKVSRSGRLIHRPQKLDF